MTTAPIILVLAATGTLIVAGVVFAALLHANRTAVGPERIVAVVLALLVIESSLYQNQNNVPIGMFHIHAGPVSFRLFDILIALALAARFVARPPNRRAPVQLLVWGAFLVWIFGAGIWGLMVGNPKDFVSYEAKAVIYLGTFVLVMAVPPDRWLASRALRGVVVMSSALATFLIVATEAGVEINLNLPLIPLSGFGVLGPDAATIFASLGIVVLAIAMYGERRRLRPLVVSLPLLAAPLASGQRAALIGLGVSLLVMAAATPFGRRRLRLTGAEIGMVFLATLGIATTVLAVSGTRSSPVPVPLAHQLQDTFGSQVKQLSATERINQWSQARALIAARPWFGWGLGKTYQYYSPGTFGLVDTDITHNIVLDLLVRSGVVGLSLFLLASLMSIRDSLMAWLREVDDVVAGIILAGTAAFIGLIGKGMFESLFEKYRLAILMGGLIGMSMSVAAVTLEARAPDGRAQAFRPEHAARMAKQ